MVRAISKLFLLAILLMFLPNHPTVSAQGVVRSNIDYIDNGQFPHLQVYLSVTDAQGFPLKNLSGSDFSIAEDGRPITGFDVTPVQNVQQPLAVTLLIDTSGSMGYKPLPTPLQNAVQAAKTFVGSLSQQDQVAIVGFANAPYIVQDFTTDKNIINTKLDTLNADGNTALYDGIVQGVGLLKNRPERRILVLITDGINTISGQFDFQSSMDEVSRWAVPIYPIGFGQVDRNELEQMATLSGGVAQIHPTSTDIESAFGTILQILREEYLIRYDSALPADGKEHNLQISVKNAASVSKSFIALPGKITLTIPFQDGQVIGGRVLLKPSVLAPAPLARMDVQLDDTLLQSILSEPFEYAWDSTSVTPGPHKFTFIVEDKVGNTARASINLKIQAPVIVTIAAPFDGQELGGITNVTAEINSLAGIANVEYYIDGDVLQKLTAPPYQVSINWDKYPKGPHVLEVKATDVNGFSDTRKIVVYAKGTNDIWFLILALGVGLAALGIPIGLRRRKASLGGNSLVTGKAILRELQGATPEKVWSLGMQDVHLGRRRGNDIQLKSSKASREQAIIRYENGRHVLYNLRQDNPPVINKIQVIEKKILETGDLIQFGDEIYRYDKQ